MLKNFNHKFEKKNLASMYISYNIEIGKDLFRSISFFIGKAGSVLTIKKVCIKIRYFHLNISLFSN